MVRRSATIALFSKDDKEMAASKTGNWFVDNPQRGRSNNSMMLLRDKVTYEEFQQVMENVKQYGEPAFVFVDNLEFTVNPCVEIGKLPVTEDGRSGWQGCVSYDTKLITKDGIKVIGEVANNRETIEVWNGEKWSEVSPIKTGEGRKLYRVHLSDGSYLDCTNNHKWLVKEPTQEGFTSVETKELDLASILQVPRSEVIMEDEGVDEPLAYEYGLFLGGFSNDLSDLDEEFVETFLQTNGLPNTIFSWNKESIIEFFVGLFGPDKQNPIFGAEGFIRDCQLLLTKVGITSSIKSTLGGEWYLYITYGENQQQTITKIKPLEGLHDSYCFEEPELHQGLFANVLTNQCNLTEINGSKCTSKENFFKACKSAAILGTLQAGYTDFDFLSNESKEIFEREALLGVSITGWMNNPEILFDEETLKEGARLVKETNKKVAKLIGINPAARTTCAKPSGNASVLLQTASGIHGEHSKYYLRNVQMNKESEVAQLIKEKNPCMVEESVWSSNGTDYVISFPVVAPSQSVYRDELYGVNLLEKVKLAQQAWVCEGTDESLCTDKRLRHNISNTITVDNWDEVTDYVYNNRQWFTGISFLGMSGDKDYAQAPNTSVLTEDGLVKTYGSGGVLASGLVTTALDAFEGRLWDACSCALGYGEDLSEETHKNFVKKEAIRRIKRFAENYFDGDILKATYCLKDVYNFHKWERIQSRATDIGWSSELSEKTYTDIDTLGAVACSGGACEITW